MGREKATEWASEKRAENKWTDVRAVDAVDLESWFAMAPAVALDFAQEIGLIAPTGVSSLQQFWEEFAARTAPQLTHHVLIAGRLDEARQVVDHVTRTLRAEYELGAERGTRAWSCHLREGSPDPNQGSDDQQG